ncbi:MAG: hypothetical protein AAF376_04565 [Pseudomonadota bacterium]
MQKSNENLDKLNMEAYRLSEKRLEMQLSAAIAADTRAISFAGICLAAAAVLAGLSENSSNSFSVLSGAFILGLAGAVSGWSARPIDFYMPGAKFSDLEEDIDQNKPFLSVVTQLGGYADKSSERNDKILKRNSKMFHLSFWIALFGVFVAILPQLPW